MQTDAELLARYAATADETAFAELARRHGAFVYRVCLRRLEDIQDAEDAAQAAFLVLARRARAIREGADLVAWLYCVAYRVSGEAVRARRRRQRREEDAAMRRSGGNAASVSPDESREVMSRLDDELARLPDLQRQAVILRYLEGRSQEEAADMAGCPVGTIGRRASDGIARLRERLALRGYALGPLVLVGVLEGEAKAVTPATLLPSLQAVPEATATGSNVVALADGAIKAMFWAKAKVLAALTATLVVTAGGAGIGLSGLPGREPGPPAAVMTPEKTREIRKHPPVALARDEAPDIHGESIEKTAERTGYTVDEIRKYFPPIREWKSEPRPDQVAGTFARDRFKPPPPPGVHPRIYFNPEDLPDIRRRLKETHVGRILMGSIRGHLLQISPRQEDWEAVPHKPTPADYEHYAKRGLRIEGRAGYHGPWVGGWANDLAVGKVPREIDGTWTNPPPESKRQYLMHLLPFEAFRCLVDEDAGGGRRIGAALATIAEALRKDMPRWSGTDNWQSVYQLLNSDSVGLAYDWAYPWMTEAQRAAVRRTIADLTRGKQYIGLDHVPAFPGNTSNWGIIHANLLPMALSIEGEEGYDPAVCGRIIEGLKKWVYVASGPEGAPFEGLVKSTYAPQWLIPLAKRGHVFLGTEWSVNHIRRFHLHVMLPWGGAYVFETGIHPPRDVAPFKHAHPSDPVVDLVYGQTLRDFFSAEEPNRGRWPNTRTTYAPWWPYLFLAEDPIGTEGSSYDPEEAFDRVMAELSRSEPLSYFSDYRGLMTARSAWNRDALMLYFEPRHVPGGHTRASRNEFVLAGLGRLWAHRTEAVEDTSELHSVVLIDGKGHGQEGGRCPAGRTAAFADTPQATFAAADAAWAYGHVLVSADHKQAQPVTVTPNDSRLHRSPLPWMDRPWSFLPNWSTGCKPAPKKDPGGHGYWISYNPVRYAYRSCGLVRGTHPYALVVDNVRKDDREHDYAWLMQVPDDLKLAQTAQGTIGRDRAMDLILADGDGRRLLIRVLAAGEGEQARQTQAGAKLETFEKQEKSVVRPYNRIVLPLHAVKGHFTVLLFPHRAGVELPQTRWGEEGRRLVVEWKDQRDEYDLHPNDDGRIRLVLKRDGREIAALK